MISLACDSCWSVRSMRRRMVAFVLRKFESKLYRVDLNIMRYRMYGVSDMLVGRNSYVD